MEVYQMVVVAGRRETAAALRRAVSVMTNSRRNHGTLGWHCQHHQPSFAQKFSKPKSIIDELSAWSWEAPPPGV
jgi:hypothetical protein